MRNCLHRIVALIISMRLNNYERNFLHRRVMLNYTNSHYVTELSASQRRVYISMKLSNYERNFLHRCVVLNLFIYLLLNYHVHYQHNQLHEIGKDLQWRTTYLESASLPVKRLYEARGRRSHAYSWASLPCLCQENHNYTLIITSI